MEKVDLATADIAAENAAKLAELFPDIVTEVLDEDGNVRHSIDVEALKAHVGDIAEDKRERYQFTWPGKQRARAEAIRPIEKTMRPCPEESVNWDTTENLYIEGDNLDALKILRETYAGKIKMIYIDPPYNTGHDFVYNDTFSHSEEDERSVSGAYDENGVLLDAAYRENRETNGRFHSDWCSMLYPRLLLAKDLLSADGAILINIDENEATNLKKLCDELFGQDNDLGTIVWDKRNPKGDARGVATQHEYIYVYAKSTQSLFEKCQVKRKKKNARAMLDYARKCYKRIDSNYDLDAANADYARWVSANKELSGGERAYNKIDADGEVYRPVSMAWPNKQEAPDDYFIPLIHPVSGKPCPVPARGWRNPPKTMMDLLSKGLILFGPDESTQPQRKYLLSENMLENIPSLLYYGGSDTALLAAMNIPFDTPKVVEVVSEHLDSFLPDGETLLDFFSGSATTAHAVMQLNAEDGGNRKFIMVQLPEVPKENSEVAKAGYKNICEIGKERIRRAGAKIAAEVEESNAQLKPGEEPKKIPDIGFRVLKIDSSNFEDVKRTPDAIEQSQLFVLADNLKSDRTPEDVLFQLFPQFQIPYTASVEKLDICGKTVYSVDDDALLACFDQEVSEDVIRAMAEREPSRAVLRDVSFVGDDALANFEEIFKTLSPETETRVV